MDEVGRKGHNERQIETVGREGQQSAVSKQQGLDEQGGGKGDVGGPRPHNDGDQGRSDRMSAGPPGDGQIEQHDHEGEGGTQGQ